MSKKLMGLRPNLMLPVALFALWAIAAPAQSPAPEQSPEPEATAPAQVTQNDQQDLSWEEITENGGIPLKIIGVISVAGFACVLYLVYVLRQEQVVPRGVQQDILLRISEGNYNEARLACSHRPSPLGAVALVAINYVQSVPHPDPQMLKDVIESEGRRQAASIQSPTHYLLDVSGVAPMVGLLGTVLGMLEAFKGVASDIVKARPQILADGVSMALITTAAGLMVGIPALACYAIFRGVASRQVGNLETASIEILTAIVRERESNELS